MPFVFVNNIKFWRQVAFSFTGPPWLHLHHFCGDSTNAAGKKARQRSLQLSTRTHFSDPQSRSSWGGQAAEWGRGGGRGGGGRSDNTKKYNNRKTHWTENSREKPKIATEAVVTGRGGGGSEEAQLCGLQQTCAGAAAAVAMTAALFPQQQRKGRILIQQ